MLLGLLGFAKSVEAHEAQAIEPGTVLLDEAQNSSVCSAWDSPVRPPGLNSPGHTIGTTTGGDGVLIGDGKVLLQCSQGNERWLVAFDLYTRKIIWGGGLRNIDDWAVGSRHFFYITSVRHGARGLRSGYTRYWLTALDLQTGRRIWRTTYPNTTTNGPNGDMSVSEGPASGNGTEQAAVVFFNGATAFDDSTGRFLWNAKTESSEAAGTYATAGIIEAPGFSNNDIDGINAVTNRVAWRLALPFVCEAGVGPADDLLLGTDEWWLGGRCFAKIDVATGQLVAEARFPSNFHQIAANPAHTLAYGDGVLAFYKTGHFMTPLWSEGASTTIPIAEGLDNSLVLAPSGWVIISNRNGKILAKVPHLAHLTRYESTLVSTPWSVIGGDIQETMENGDTVVVQVDQPS